MNPIGSGAYGSVTGMRSSTNEKQYALKIRGGLVGDDYPHIGLGPDSVAACTALHLGLELSNPDPCGITGATEFKSVAIQVAVFPKDSCLDRLSPVIGMDYIKGDHPYFLSSEIRDKLLGMVVRAIECTNFPEENVRYDMHSGNLILDTGAKALTKIDTTVEYDRHIADYPYLDLTSYLNHPLVKKLPAQ